MYHSILVPLDGSAFGEHALPFALSLARSTAAQVHLVHVHAPPQALGTDRSDVEWRDAEGIYLEGLVQRIKARWDVPITTMLLDGPIVQSLVEYAATNQADVIVMTTHGRGALSRFWLGSVADALIRQVSIPVLLVRPNEERANIEQVPSFRHILIPLDGSLIAEQAVQQATELGSSTRADYTLLQAIEPIYTGYGTELFGIDPDSQALQEVRHQVQQYLHTVAARITANNGVHVHTHTVFNIAANAILEYAAKHNSDLIVLTTQGWTGLSSWLVGGVADKVIRGSTIPVLLYRPRS